MITIICINLNYLLYNVSQQQILTLLKDIIMCILLINVS